ncbi:MAG: GTPase HflX [Deltaproteobacteria bacterium]|nr:MAG: GTPase HflX [Deltaproteobacteria bacterium]
MKFHSDPIAEHHEVPLADDGQWEALVDHWQTRESSPKTRETDGNRCYVVSVIHPEETSTEGKLREIMGLVEAQDDHIVGHEVIYLAAIHPRTYLGQGKSQELAKHAREAGADLLVLDAALSPSQMRNLEDLTGFAVCDREAVILNVFLRHAKTKAARIQVEIAHLEYLRPRIRGLGINMDQQAGGVMGNRGPGETASELLARRLDSRLADLRKKLGKIEQQSSHQRKHRVDARRIALVGYTNAGKSSLMNALTSADGAVRNRPFETLDTTTRSLTRYGVDILLSDTVGFIRQLPQQLFASFASTLAEVKEASLLALVIDVSDPDWRLHRETSEAVLEQLGAHLIPRVYIFNKVDRVHELPEGLFDGIAPEHPIVTLSAHRSEDLEQLKETLVELVCGGEHQLQVFVPYVCAAAMSKVYGHCRVVESESHEDGMWFSLEGSPRTLRQIRNDVEEVQA